jgi:peptidoglycan/LPS O-acetylase OafA/YrhL
MDNNVAADARRIRWSAAAGTIAPIWFWVTLTTLALLHGTIDVSGHQLLRYGLLMYVGFFAYGSLTLAFVWGLRRRMPSRRRSSAAIVALTLFGCGPLLGTFTEGVEQGPPQSWHAWLHFTGFLIVSLIPIVALPLFGSAVWSDARWRRLGPLSVASALVVTVVVFLPSSPTEGYALWSGPGSMADIALIGIWQVVVSRRLARLAEQPATAEQTADARAAENALG